MDKLTSKRRNKRTNEKTNLHRTSFVSLVLLQYNFFEHFIILCWFTNHFSDFSCVSDLDILSSYFISFTVWIADIGQVSVMSL